MTIDDVPMRFCPKTGALTMMEPLAERDDAFDSNRCDANRTEENLHDKARILKDRLRRSMNATAAILARSTRS